MASKQLKRKGRGKKGSLVLRKLHGIEDSPLAAGLGRRTGVSLGHHTSARHEGRAGRHEARASELDDRCAKHFGNNMSSGRDFAGWRIVEEEEMVGGSYVGMEIDGSSSKRH